MGLNDVAAILRRSTIKRGYPLLSLQSELASVGTFTGRRITTKPVKPMEGARLEDLDDAALVERAQRRDGAAFWLIIKRHNQRLYRVARAVLDDDTVYLVGRTCHAYPFPANRDLFRVSGRIEPEKAPNRFKRPRRVRTTAAICSVVGGNSYPQTIFSAAC